MPLMRWRREERVTMPVVRSRLRASAQRFTLKNKKVVAKQATRSQEWQAEGWGYFDDIPELKYSIWFMGNVMSKVRLYVGWRDPEQPDSDPIPVTDPKANVSPAIAARAQAELHRLKGPLGGLPEICREFNMNAEITGECYLVGIGPHESADETDVNGEPVLIEEAWDIRSISEVEVTEGKIKIKSSPNDQNPYQLDPENDTAIRIWQRHPRWSMQADCNMRGVLNECEALVLLINQVKAEAKSRMSAGYFTLPNEVIDSAEPEPTDGEDGEEAQVNPVMLTLYEGATDPIEDASSAAAVAPTFLRGPAEFLKPEYIRHIPIGREASAVLETRIQARIERLARGLNLPVETVMGHQQTTFSNAEQVAADQFADHFYPRDVLLADALTVSFLQPNLLDAGVDPDVVEQLCVWFDPNDQIKQTDLAVLADKGYELGVISAEAWRRVKGFTADDAPSVIERLLRLLDHVRSIDPGITTGVVGLLGEPLEIPESIPAGTTTPVAPDPTQSEPQVSIERAILIAAEQRRMGKDVDMSDLFATILLTAHEQGGDIGDVARRMHRVLDELAARPAALPAPAAAHRNIGHDLMALDRDLRSRLIVAADKAMTRALERAGNKLRAKSTKHRELVVGTHPRYVAATLGPALVASAGFTDDQLIGADAWEQLRAQYLTWAADAQRRALGIAETIAPPSAAFRATIVQRQADELASSWEWLSDELTKLAHVKLYQPDPTEPPLGESDPTVSIPAGLMRQAIARAGGATGIRTGQKVRAAAGGGTLDVPPDAGEYVAIDNGAPLGGIGTGDTTMEVLENGEAGVEAYQWEYGPAFRAHPFEEHELLDQEVFDSFDSDVLLAGDWIGDYYFPGDHDGCNCDIVPIIVEAGAILDSLDVEPPAGGSGDAEGDTAVLDVPTELTPEPVVARDEAFHTMLSEVTPKMSYHEVVAWEDRHGDQASAYMQAIERWTGSKDEVRVMRDALMREDRHLTVGDDLLRQYGDRYRDPRVVEKLNRSIETLGKALDNAPQMSDTLYRGFHLHGEYVAMYENLSVGDTLSLGPSSFSIDRLQGVAFMIGGDNRVLIEVASGARGTPVWNLSTFFSYEQEVISGGRFEILSIDRDAQLTAANLRGTVIKVRQL